MTTLETLKAARTAVEAGWCQNLFIHHRPDGGTDYCILGALDTKTSRAIVGEMTKKVYHSHELDGPIGVLREVIFGDTGGPRELDIDEKNDIASWNNSPARTKQDILDALDAAIVRQEACQREAELVSA